MADKVINKDNKKIIVEHLKKSFGHLEVLKDISCEIDEGEVVVVIGPSGSGKSTFLRCINRLEEITGGHVYVDGADMADPKTDLNKVRRHIGMVFQHFGGDPGRQAGRARRQKHRHVYDTFAFKGGYVCEECLKYLKDSFQLDTNVRSTR